MVEGRKFRFEIAVIGDKQVGKTSLMDKFTEGKDGHNYSKTTGFHLSFFNSGIEGDKIKMLMFDIAADDTFLIFQPSFYARFFRYKRAAIIVCSLEDTEQGKASITHIPDWHKKVLEFGGNIPIYLFANKVDLVDENGLDETKLKNLVEENNLRDYYLTSSITGDRAIKAFNDICMELYDKYKVRT
ncbi:MAG: hypothetical protein ACW96X_08725 [Promethearchaeota archaeon]|jgi:small GTP-binding protein